MWLYCGRAHHRIFPLSVQPIGLYCLLHAVLSLIIVMEQGFVASLVSISPVKVFLILISVIFRILYVMPQTSIR